jgi:hypothetical protein
MIDTLLHAAVCVAILGYCFYACRVDIAESAAPSGPSGALRGAASRCSNEGAPETTDRWTALDERQLIRLLRDSAP